MEGYSDGDLEEFDLSCRMYEQAQKFGPADLKSSTIDSILRKTPAILNTKSFQGLSNESLIEILKDERLAVENEVQLFKTILRIGHQKCTHLKLPPNSQNLRRILKDLIPLVRFPLMTEKEFGDYVEPENILEAPERELMLKWFKVNTQKVSTEEYSSVMSDLNKNGPFNTNPRRYIPVERNSNICETTLQFSKALKKLEDFSTCGDLSGNVNVTQLEFILAQMQSKMTQMTTDIKATRLKELFDQLMVTREKTTHLEFLIARDQKEFDQSQKELNLTLKKINGELDMTRKELKTTKIHLDTTTLTLHNTKSELQETRLELQRTVQNLTRTRGDITKGQIFSEGTKENFGGSERDTKFNVQKMADDVERSRKELKMFQMELKQTKVHLEETKREMERTKLRLQSTNASLQDKSRELPKSKILMEDFKSNRM